MSQYLDLVASIPTNEHGVDTAAGRGVLASTGVLWESCDKLIDLASTGLVSLAVKKADAYHALIKDAIAELEEWDLNELDSDSDSDSDIEPLQEQLQNTHIKADGNISNLTPAKDTTSPPPTSIPYLLTQTLSHLRLLRLLYPALRKRRLLTFPPLTSTTPISFTSSSPPQLQRLDTIMNHLKRFSEEADEVAGALYEGKEEDVRKGLNGLREMGVNCVEGARFDWEDGEDEFSEWGVKWVRRMGEMGRS